MAEAFFLNRCSACFWCSMSDSTRRMKCVSNFYFSLLPWLFSYLCAVCRHRSGRALFSGCINMSQSRWSEQCRWQKRRVKSCDWSVQQHWNPRAHRHTHTHTNRLQLKCVLKTKWIEQMTKTYIWWCAYSMLQLHTYASPIYKFNVCMSIIMHVIVLCCRFVCQWLKHWTSTNEENI